MRETFHCYFIICFSSLPHTSSAKNLIFFESKNIYFFHFFPFVPHFSFSIILFSLSFILLLLFLSMSFRSVNLLDTSTNCTNGWSAGWLSCGGKEILINAITLAFRMLCPFSYFFWRYVKIWQVQLLGSGGAQIHQIGVCTRRHGTNFALQNMEELNSD